MSSVLLPSNPKSRRLVLTALAVLTVALLVFYGDSLVPRTWQMNGMLKDDPVLAAYPYRPRVVNFLNGVVTVTRPYTDASGPAAFLTHIDPQLRDLPPDAPAMQEALRALREFERRIIMVLVDQPDVESLNWWFDRAWYSRNEVPLPADMQRPR